MKVRELIALLQGFDPELPVMVNGYEGGYLLPTPASVGQADMYDDYAEHDDWDAPRETFPAVLVSRRAPVEDSVHGYCGKYDTGHRDF